MSVPPIRPARASDLPSIEALDRAVFGEPTCPAFFFRQALDALGPSFWVAGDEPLSGYVLGSLAAGEPDAWVWSLGVAPEARGRGVARALMDRIESVLFARGAEGVRLHVSPSNPVALGMYERRGYQRTALVPDAFGPGHPRWILRLSR